MFLLQLTGLTLVSAFHESIRMNYKNFEGTVGGIGSKLMYDFFFFFTGKHLQLNVAADTVCPKTIMKI